MSVESHSVQSGNVRRGADVEIVTTVVICNINVNLVFAGSDTSVQSNVCKQRREIDGAQLAV